MNLLVLWFASGKQVITHRRTINFSQQPKKVFYILIGLQFAIGLEETILQTNSIKLLNKNVLRLKFLFAVK